MSDLEVWVEIKLPIKVTHFSKGRPETRWEPADPGEVEFEVDAPKEVQDWIERHVDRADWENIESEIIEKAEDYRQAMIEEWHEQRGIA